MDRRQNWQQRTTKKSKKKKELIASLMERRDNISSTLKTLPIDEIRSTKYDELVMERAQLVAEIVTL